MEKLDNFGLYNYFLTVKSKHIDSTAKLVAASLIQHRNVYSFKCCPSMRRIATQLNFNKGTVEKAVKRLRDTNEIVRLKLMDGEKPDHNQYYFMYDLVDQKEIYNDGYLANRYQAEHEKFEYCIEQGLFEVCTF